MDLTEEERDFLRDVAYSESFNFSFTDKDGPIIQDARVVAHAFVGGVLVDRFPNRVQRLLLYRILKDEIATAEEDLLHEILASSFHWVYREDIENWCSLGVQDYEKSWLATVVGKSKRTLTALVKKIATETLQEAEKTRV